MTSTALQIMLEEAPEVRYVIEAEGIRFAANE